MLNYAVRRASENDPTLALFDGLYRSDATP
jgi:hypothetical protein